MINECVFMYISENIHMSVFAHLYKHIVYVATCLHKCMRAYVRNAHKHMYKHISQKCTLVLCV